MSRNRKKFAKDHIKQKRVITIPNIIACLAFEKLASYNFCQNVTYRAVSLVGHDLCYSGQPIFSIRKGSWGNFINLIKPLSILKRFSSWMFNKINRKVICVVKMFEILSIFRCFIMNNAEAYSGTCQISKRKNVSKIVNAFQPLTIFAILFILDL